LGLVFAPLNTVAFATLPGDLRTDGAALWTLIRNLGSSVGISLIIAQLTNMMTKFHAQLAEHITPFNRTAGFRNLDGAPGGLFA
jgi:DHA2 family multidrug resistance protein